EDVGGDGVQPRPRRALLAQAGRAAPRAHQRLLECIVGIVRRSEHAVAVCMELGAVLLDEIGEVPLFAGGVSGQDGFSTTISVWPVGSRNQNIGGTGSPMRETSASTSTPRPFIWVWVSSMLSVVRVVPVCW